ncbi:MAG: LiaF transmembrane domain-containing protein [Burkholderiales bacterium]
MSNLGWIPHIGPLLRQWWPVLLIVLGVVMLVQRS